MIGDTAIVAWGLRGALTACALGLAAASPKPAEPTKDRPTWASAYVGRWTLSGVSEGDPVCEIALRGDAVIGGAGLDVSATCRRNYPFEDVTAWRGDGRAIVLADATRKTRLMLRRAPDGSFNGQFADGRAVSLERGRPERPVSLAALFDQEGTFTLSGPDNAAPCGFAVAVRTTTSGALTQSGRCAPPWKGRGWARWRFLADTLRLEDRKGAAILVLTRADAFTFEAKQASGSVFFGPGVIDGSEMLDATPPRGPH